MQTELFETETFIIGSQQLDMIKIDISPEKFVHTGQQIDSYFLGMPWSTSDQVSRLIHWKRTSDFNEDHRIGRASQFNSTNIIVQFKFDFVERVYKIDYFGVFDIMSKIGGFQASLLPLIRFAAPLFGLYFLNKLSIILRDRIKSDLKT